jgi:hypothetical protein
MDILFKIDPERITFGDMVMMEDPQAASKRELLNLMSHHMTDGKGSFVPAPKAKEILGALTLDKLTVVAKTFYDAVEELGKLQLPPESATRS